MSEAQLVLPLDHTPAMTREDFLVGEANRQALAVIESWPRWQAPVVLLTGPAGSGKSHLVEIWKARSGAAVIPAVSLSDADGDALTSSGAVAVEDVDRSIGRDAALFHLLNQAREHGAAVLLTARDADVANGASLPDLGSRLRAAQPAILAAPEEDLLLRVMVKLFADRQLVVPPALAGYFLTRIERTFDAAARLVRRLDELALATGRPITRQLAAPLLRPDEEPSAG